MKSIRARAPRMVDRSVPRKRMAPDVGAMRLRIIRASVVLPEPDSPTMVKISGRAVSREKLTSSTALKAPRPNRPPKA